MKQRICAGSAPPDVRIDHRLVVVAEDARIQRVVVQPNLTVRRANQLREVRQAGANLRSQGSMNAFFLVSQGDRTAIRIAEAQPDPRTVGCTVHQYPRKFW